MSQNVFKRTEKKYIITREQNDKFLMLTKKHLQPDQYPKETISNLYYDTASGEMIEKSIAKPLFKQKVRLRSYGVPTFQDFVFLELKTKFSGIVGKRRQKLKLGEFYKYYAQRYQNQSDKNRLPYETQILKEIDYVFDLYPLEPFCLVSYERHSFRCSSFDLRITFDQDLRSRHKDLRLEKGNYGDPFFENDERVMEIKAQNAYPIWLTEILSELKIYPTSFSKIGRIYQKERSKIC